MSKKIAYTLSEGEQVLAEFNADNSDGLLCFYKKVNESSVVITNKRIIAITQLGLKVCCFGNVLTSFKECLISGLSGINGYTYYNCGICCCRNKLFNIKIGTIDGSSISFYPKAKSEDEVQAILHTIAKLIENK